MNALQGMVKLLTLAPLSYCRALKEPQRPFYCAASHAWKEQPITLRPNPTLPQMRGRRKEVLTATQIDII